MAMTGTDIGLGLLIGGLSAIPVVLFIYFAERQRKRNL
jgi:F0F1-type ATP synthase assembly protein I